MDLNTIWFGLFGVLIIGYAILDGFDLGVGVLALFGKSDHERRLHLNAIGPIWDGNEVWLLTGGGALFAAFPAVYATVFSGFYLALMLLLVFLIGRAVSFEFRSKVESPTWRRVWDLAFGLGSLGPALLYGVAVGNIMRGVPLDERGSFAGTFLGLLNPYALLLGVLGLVMFVTHGALYMALKSDGELQRRMKRWASRGWVGWVVLYLAATGATWAFAPHLVAGTLGRPLLWIALLLVVGGLALQPLLLRGGRLLASFLASSVAIAGSTMLVGVSLYPRLVPALGDLDRSLTIYNASSTPRTLTAMLVIALIGMPIVIGYTIFIYRVFKGKVEIGEGSY
jgi:cytochrome bd ubiquinol oxidase subunit II